MTKVTLTKKEGDKEYYEVDQSVPGPTQVADVVMKLHATDAEADAENLRIIGENEEAIGREAGFVDKQRHFNSR